MLCYSRYSLSECVIYLFTLLCAQLFALIFIDTRWQSHMNILKNEECVPKINLFQSFDIFPKDEVFKSVSSEFKLFWLSSMKWTFSPFSLADSSEQNQSLLDLGGLDGLWWRLETSASIPWPVNLLLLPLWSDLEIPGRVLLRLDPSSNNVTYFFLSNNIVYFQWGSPEKMCFLSFFQYYWLYFLLLSHQHQLDKSIWSWHAFQTSPKKAVKLYKIKEINNSILCQSYILELYHLDNYWLSHILGQS